MAYNKIGFLASGGGGNANGIGDYVAQLDTAGIPAVVFCNDGDVGISDVPLDSTVPHVMAFRVVGSHPDGPEYYSVPRYELPPAEAAQAHWDKLFPMFPDWFKARRDKVWLLPINEPDHERSDWLGWFSLAFAQIANGQGYRIASLAFTCGEPEPEDWKTAGMKAYLQYCAANREKAAVCLHEYSLDPTDIWKDSPYMIGRFQFLYDICDTWGIARPYILIGEWGWGAFDVPSVDMALQHIDQVAALYAKYPEVLGAATWYLGPGFGGIANRVQPFIAPVTQLTLSKEYPGPDPSPPPPPPPPPEPGECRGAPRVQFARHYQVVAPTVSGVDALKVFREGFAAKRTTGWSFDDAGLGDLDSRTVEVFGLPAGQHQGIRNWYEDHYPGVVVKFSAVPGVEPPPQPPPPPPPPPGKALFGLHASADSWLMPGELAVFQTVKVELVKVLSSMDPNGVSQLAAALPNAKWIVRAFLDFGGRNVSPSQFFNDTIGDVKRTLNLLQGKDVAIEIHNEPNLYAEGLGSSWADGTQFSGWFQAVLTLYRQALPGVPLLFPGLSPGGTVPGVRQDHTLFIEQARPAVTASHGLCIHSYWSAVYSMATALAVLDDMRGRFPAMPVWVTEASNNKVADPAVKGQEYIAFWNALRQRAQIRGVTYFVASASHPDFQNEVWVRNGGSVGVAEIVAGR